MFHVHKGDFNNLLHEIPSAGFISNILISGIIRAITKLKIKSPIVPSTKVKLIITGKNRISNLDTISRIDIKIKRHITKIKIISFITSFNKSQLEKPNALKIASSLLFEIIQ